MLPFGMKEIRVVFNQRITKEEWKTCCTHLQTVSLTSFQNRWKKSGCKLLGPRALVAFLFLRALKILLSQEF